MDKRRWIQAIATLITNLNIKGFFQNKIYTGDIKKICLPGLNCYSCPGAIGSCPIGSLQAVIGTIKYDMSFYVLGMMSLFGVLFGRLICGFLCPFGFFQDMLNKIPGRKIKVKKSLDRNLKKVKYAILLFFVILMPMFLTNEFGISPPYFCEYICPAGTLEGGIPLVLFNKSLRGALGGLFIWKMAILIAIVVLSVMISRPFCRYLCPLGAFYGLFNKISFYGYSVDMKKCISCDKCVKSCDMDIKIYEDPDSMECIRCGKCAGQCPTKAIEKGIRINSIKSQVKKSDS